MEQIRKLLLKNFPEFDLVVKEKNVQVKLKNQYLDEWEVDEWMKKFDQDLKNYFGMRLDWYEADVHNDLTEYIGQKRLYMQQTFQIYGERH
jgi:hypothetical protein